MVPSFRESITFAIRILFNMYSSLWLLLTIVVAGTVSTGTADQDQLPEEQRRNTYNKPTRDETNYFSSYRVANGFADEPNAPTPQAYYLVPVQSQPCYSGKNNADHIVSDVQVSQTPNRYSYQVYEKGPHHLKEIRQAAYIPPDKRGDSSY